MNNQYQSSKTCEKQFFHENHCNFILTILTQTVFSIVGIAISFLMMITIESIEYTDHHRIVIAGILFGTIIVMYIIFGFLQKTFRNRYLKQGLSQFKRYIFQKILGKSIREFGSATAGKIINAFSNDLSSIETNYLNGTLQIIQQMIMFIVGVGAMYYINPILATCVIAACIIPIAFSMLFGRRLGQKERKTSDEGEGFVDQIKDLLGGFILIKSFKAEKEILNLFDQQNFSLEEAKRDRRDTNDTISLTSTFSSILVIGLIFTIGLYLAYQDIISIGGIIAFVELSHYATGPVEKMIPLWTNRKASITLIHKVEEMIEGSHESDQKFEIRTIDHNISMENVSFAYENGKEVLDKVNLTFEQGKSYAIVGGSGCGKSTLIQLLLGYYSEYNGKILYDGNELSDISLDSLYDVVSVISQNVFLFDSTIRNNITMFKDFDEDRIEEAIRLAGLTNFIQEKGMDYECGEGGKNLSGGEKQRISIARCLLRKTPVIIMDEATAALDNKTAFEVEEAILNLNHLTKIVVTHKSNREILKKYDEIIVLRNGDITEQGKFEDLMKARNYFYSLYHITA
ncbi:MAG: ABC transporter ATP-binding protein [Clostridiales bacterium]|nr:ABC transporter ATP-binding protein [Clostridiales bacterium]